MRLPRRVPWASTAELEQLCSWIYATDSDLDSKILAIHRLVAWRAITPLPSSLESTLSVLTVIVHDETRDMVIKTAAPAAAMALRQCYAAALVRLVNGLVDHFQVGAYARSIASIAAQINLPAWLVELRHAATHEDLPSLELLRSAAQESLSWLLHHYFLPTLAPASAASHGASQLPPLVPLLKQYKTLLKQTSRDASLVTRYKPAIGRVLRAFERWVGAARVTAAASVFSGWGDDDADSQDGDAKERWALARLCDALITRGGLVPVSSRKRTLAAGRLAPSPALVALWWPLLSSMRAEHPGFPTVLVTQIGTALVPRSADAGADGNGNDADRVVKLDATYDMCLAAWAAWAVDTWSVDGRALSKPGTDMDVLRREDVVATLLIALGNADLATAAGRRGAEVLLKALCDNRPELENLASRLAPVMQARHTELPWSDADAGVMTERLRLLLSPVEEQIPPDDPIDTHGAPEVRETGDPAHEVLPRGWHAVGAAWKPCPIGVYVDA